MDKLSEIYQRLYSAFGPQHWWPGDSPFEIAVGAILTQNTNWTNVEKAIENLKKGKALNAKSIHEMEAERLASLIRPAGYFNVKVRRLKAFMHFFVNDYSGSMAALLGKPSTVHELKFSAILPVSTQTAFTTDWLPMHWNLVNMLSANHLAR